MARSTCTTWAGSETRRDEEAARALDARSQDGLSGVCREDRLNLELLCR